MQKTFIPDVWRDIHQEPGESSVPCMVTTEYYMTKYTKVISVHHISLNVPHAHLVINKSVIMAINERWCVYITVLHPDYYYF